MTEFIVTDDDGNLIGKSNTLNGARDCIDAWCNQKYGERTGGLRSYWAAMRNYGATKDEAGLWSEVLELRLGAYETRAFTVYMPAGWEPKQEGYSLL